MYNIQMKNGIDEKKTKQKETKTIHKENRRWTCITNVGQRLKSKYSVTNQTSWSSDFAVVCFTI